jgi:hypothetical protein
MPTAADLDDPDAFVRGEAAWDISQLDAKPGDEGDGEGEPS